MTKDNNKYQRHNNRIDNRHDINGHNNRIDNRKNRLIHMVIGTVVMIVFICALGQGNLRKEVRGQEQIRPEGSTSESISESVNRSADQITDQSMQETADDSYFSSSLLVGDSRAETLGLYSGLADWDVYAARNLDIETVQNSKIVSDGTGQMCTVPEILEKTTYSSIYVSFGIGELGWYKERFISAYKAFLDKATVLQPYAKIYVMSILPVSAELSSDDSVYNNPEIDNFNLALQELCKSYDRVEYLDVAESVAVNGVLPEDAGTDGIHFNKEYSQKIMDYIRSHVNGVSVAQ